MNIDYILKDSIKINFIRRKLIEWKTENSFDFPWRKTKNSFYQLIAEIFLQRTKAEQVIPVFMQFCEKYKKTDDLVNEKEENLYKIIKPLGLKGRTKKLIALSNYLEYKYNRRIPDSFDKLVSIPGIGPYTASAYLSLYRNKFGILLDSNIVRFYGRLFGFQIDGETRRKKWINKVAFTLTPKRNFKKYNYALIDFTRVICSNKPLCDKCSL